MAIVKTAVDIVTQDTARFLLALVLFLGTLLLLVLQRPVPDVLYDLDFVAVGFFFAVVGKSGA